MTASLHGSRGLSAEGRSQAGPKPARCPNGRQIEVGARRAPKLLSQEYFFEITDSDLSGPPWQISPFIGLKYLNTSPATIRRPHFPPLRSLRHSTKAKILPRICGGRGPESDWWRTRLNINKSSLPNSAAQPFTSCTALNAAKPKHPEQAKINILHLSPVDTSI